MSLAPPSAPVHASKGEARRARLRRLRVVAAAWVVSAFVATFGMVYIRMATGHDPALGTSVLQSQATTAAGSSTSDGADDTTQSEAPATSSTGSSSDEVTTSQS